MERSSGGCWTCRIRHRKCDESHPHCKECESRRIHCHGYGSKPGWVDNEPQLKAELARIKRAVKDNARSHRGPEKAAPAPTTVDKDQPTAGALRKESPNTQDNQGRRDDQAGTLSRPRSALDFRESQLLIHYLDYIFPLQYAYYEDRPEFGGRGWLLWLLMRNGPMYQAMLTLAALHQSTRFISVSDKTELELIEYHTRALQTLREAMSDYTASGPSDNNEQLIEFLASGLSLISFEVFRGGLENWQPHLNALCTVVSRTIGYQSPPQLELNTDGLGNAYRFLLANLLWFDILGSTSCGSSPQTPYNKWLHEWGIETANVMGCYSWIMAIIGDIACLNSRSDAGVRVDALKIQDKLEAALARLKEDETAPPMTIAVSRVFASAALVELHTNCANLCIEYREYIIRVRVTGVIEAIRLVPKTISLRGLAWCICVAGSMAAEDQQPFFESLMAGILDHAAPNFTNCGTVLHIMKECWAHRKRLPEEHVTWRDAMNILGPCALLV